jgi:hypothetical protein
LAGGSPNATLRFDAASTGDSEISIEAGCSGSKKRRVAEENRRRLSGRHPGLKVAGKSRSRPVGEAKAGGRNEGDSLFSAARRDLDEFQNYRIGTIALTAKMSNKVTIRQHALSKTKRSWSSLSN